MCSHFLSDFIVQLLGHCICIHLLRQQVFFPIDWLGARLTQVTFWGEILFLSKVPVVSFCVVHFNLVVKHSRVFFWLVCTLFLRKWGHNIEACTMSTTFFSFFALLFENFRHCWKKISPEKVTCVSLAPSHSIVALNFFLTGDGSSSDISWDQYYCS